MTDREKNAASEPSPLLGVSRVVREPFSLLGFFKALFGGKRPQPRQPKLPRPSQSVLASRTTAELSSERRK